MTVLWFIVWLAANILRQPEPLLFDPVNIWTGTLILAVALDLSRQHVPHGGKPKQHAKPKTETPAE